MTVALLATLALTISAGNWQSRRAAEKIERQRLMDERGSAAPLVIGERSLIAPDVEWRTVTITGRPMTEQTVLLDNRVYRTRAGYHVLTPIAPTGGGPAVLVNRGWIAGAASRDAPPAIPALVDPTTITGVAVAWPTRSFELKSVVPEAPRGQAPIWQAVTLERYRDATRLTLQSVLVQQVNDTRDGLVREWPAPATGVEKHRMYSLQWYSFAVLALVLYVVLNLKRV
jgi:surfeit locus 1 family protein